MKRIIDFPKLLKSFAAASQGLKLASKEQTFRIFVLAALMVIILMLLFQIPLCQKLTLILTITFVLTFELINSQIERILDIFYPNHHPKIRIIKDITAGAVLLISLSALIIGLLIFLPYFLAIIASY